MAKLVVVVAALLAQLAGGLAPTPLQNHRRTRRLATPPETQAIAKPEASADDALLIESALAFARRTSPADAVDRASHRSRAAQLSEEELRAVLVGRGILEAAAADVPAGTLAELLGEDGSMFASLEGLSITPVAMSLVDDAVAKRSWVAGGKTMCDSGWLLRA